MTPPHAPTPASGDPFPRLLELARLWSARPRWDELQYALRLAEGDAARLHKEREDLHDLVARGHPPEVVQLQRGILAHEEQTSAGSSRQLLRWLHELCELHNLTQSHAPHLLGHVPDVHQFTGRTDRPPPSDAACEAYAGQVRAFLGQLLAEEQRRRAGDAVVAAHSPTDTKRKGRGKHIEAQMLKMISEDAARCDWTARVWADRLGCSEGTIKGTAAWKRAMQARKLRDAERVVRTGKRQDRRRNGRT